MNHATVSSIDALLMRLKAEDSVPFESNTQFCDGKSRATLASPEPNNVFTAWDAWHVFQNEPGQLAIDSLKNIDCPVCRVAIDAAFEGIRMPSTIVIDSIAARDRLEEE